MRALGYVALSAWSCLGIVGCNLLGSVANWDPPLDAPDGGSVAASGEHSDASTVTRSVVINAPSRPPINVASSDASDPDAGLESSEVPSNEPLPNDGDPVRDENDAATAEAEDCAPEKPFSTRRLTRYELLSTLGDVLGDEVMASPAVVQAATVLPDEPVGDITASFQNAHNLQHVQGLMQVSEAIVAKLRSSPELLRAVGGECAEQTSDAAVSDGGGDAGIARTEDCASKFLDSISVRLLRRPVDDTRKQAWLQAYSEASNPTDGILWLLQRVLLSPELSFHLWSAQDSYSVASKLSYAIIGKGPDAQLLDAAQSGELLTLKNVRKHAERLANTNGARAMFRRVMENWLGLQTRSTVNPTVAAAMGISADDLAQEAYEELLEFSDYATFDYNATAPELMTLALGFPRSERMALLYGSELAGEEPVKLENGHRGLLLRVAPLSSGRLYTSPILRGAYVRKHLLCDPLPTPDFAAIDAALKEEEAIDRSKLSNREATTQITSPNDCVGCHSLINPLGFALESFDSLGAWREEETVLDETGAVVGVHAIDTHVSGLNIATDEPDEVEDAESLNQVIASSENYHACVAERLFSTAQLRPLSASKGEQCFLNKFTDDLMNGVSVRDTWLETVVQSALTDGGEPQ